ncbi:uncharacterized protein LTR77_001495 [Saxophila tyrrhenica]|uniref:Metallo-beta-lactamase domain-containing protein n=1 Tax=Saxophila tyrrhenica TaxID=1690608 RepID=A0AAV9PKG0_9PEZI|nr:hypothetical protein LTR77_001495 [Saxophila tyrrhenica]
MSAAPASNIPPSSSTVSVSIIDTTSSIKGVDTWKFLSPSIKGHDYLSTLAFSFFIEHSASKRKLMFDLGIRKDWQNSSPFLIGRFKMGGYELTVKKSVREILEAEGIDGRDIEAVIWSHWHFDHTGNPDEFEKSTTLIVGPGFSSHKLPGYPKDPNSSILESDYAGRELKEIDFSGSDLKIGKLDAYDYFNDGSFYLLNSPGHAIGHLCALARVTSSPDSFILMGGDAFHHAGELRPSPYLPLPADITPHPFQGCSSCPGEMFESLLPEKDSTKPFYIPSPQQKVPMHLDPDEAVRTIQKLQEMDVREDILMAAAHDDSLYGIIDLFPKTANNFVKEGEN